MTGMTDLTATAALAHITGKTTWTFPTVWLGLFNTAPTDAGVITGEVPATNGYTRVAATGAQWATPTAGGTQPSTIANASAISFPAATSTGWGTVNSWGLFNAASGAGTLLFWDYMGNFPWLPFTVAATTGVITSTAHGYAAGDPTIISFEYGGNAPTFTTSNFTAPVGGLTTTALSGNDTFSVQNAGVTVVTNSSGDGSIRKIAPQGIAGGVTASFAIGTLTLSMA